MEATTVYVYVYAYENHILKTINYYQNEDFESKALQLKVIVLVLFLAYNDLTITRLD